MLFWFSGYFFGSLLPKGYVFQPFFSKKVEPKNLVCKSKYCVRAFQTMAVALGCLILAALSS
jgi:hypothetical protein